MDAAPDGLHFGSLVVSVLVVPAGLEVLLLLDRQVDLLSPLHRTDLAEALELPQLPLELDGEELLPPGALLNRSEGQRFFSLGQVGLRFEGKLGLAVELAGIVDALDALEEQEAVIGKNTEVLLLFAQQGVGDLLAEDHLRAWFLLDHFEGV